MRSSAIAASGLRKAFDDKIVLDGIDLDVPAGTVFSLLGPNGSGKTTTVNVLSTLMKADGGTICVAGHDIATETKAVRALIGVTGQFAAVDELLTGQENMQLMAELKRLRTGEGRRIVTEQLERFDLAESAQDLVTTYSGGMRRSWDHVRDTRRDVMPTFATPRPIAATVQVAGAHVRVTASDRTDTVVLVQPINEASCPDVRVADKTKVDFAGGRLSVKTTRAGDKDGSVAITIDLPAGSSLVAYLAHSVVHADGALGECEVHMASGRVQLDRVNALQANIAAGEVAIGHIAGRANVEGRSVSIRIAEILGAGRLMTSGGRSWIGHASADLDLSSGSGAFDIERADGNVSATTASGAIRIGRLTRGQAKLMNGSGNIEIGISESTAASIDVNSERGSVRNSVPSIQDPNWPDNVVKVHARTRHGDIIIQPADASVTSTS